MKEHPIIFNAEMVRAILDSRKTQTRRVIKPQPQCDIVGAYFDVYGVGPQWNWWTHDGKVCNGHDIIKCSYGVPGDRLWVRETWCEIPELAPEGTAVYKATDYKGWLEYEVEPIKWWPSIHMPRWASRILLEVKNVRVERVQDISDQDVKAEGVNFSNWCMAQHEFAILWGSINAKRGYSWESNPWVWVIEFERLSCKEER